MIQPDALFFYHNTLHNDYSQLLLKTSEKKRVIHTGIFKTLLFAFDIPTSEIHKPRAHSMQTSLLCYNLDLLQQSYKIKCPSNLLRGVHDYLLIYFTIGIDSISINFCSPISILLGQLTYIQPFIKPTNKTFNIKKTLPIITFFPDTHNGFSILQINIMVDVSSHLRKSI